jgi:hypothetical protein
MMTYNQSEYRVAVAVDQYWRKYYCAPTMRELAAAMGLKAYSAVHDYLHNAASNGLIAETHDGGQPQYAPWWAYNAVVAAAAKTPPLEVPDA